jgi:hypothetical protein|tara:strand:+ start:3727 stop:3942 length:216 start_codon:yes stop_codon:yes gene_type:complete
MIIPKMLINSVATALTKHFKLDKIMTYVFDDNELDDKVKELEKKVDLLEKIAHSPKDFECKYKPKKEIKYG